MKRSCCNKDTKLEDKAEEKKDNKGDHLPTSSKVTLTMSQREVCCGNYLKNQPKLHKNNLLDCEAINMEAEHGSKFRSQGVPRSGKTTFIKHLGNQWIWQNDAKSQQNLN